MAHDLTPQDKQRIEEGIRGKYVKVAASPEGLFRYPTGRVGLEALRYPPEVLKALPEPVTASYCGVGNPFSLGPIYAGEAVLDVGCGAGVDSLAAAMFVGPEGTVTGVDLVPEMLERARENLKLTPLTYVTFLEASSENLPFPDASFDAVISNGVFNLVADKVKALQEVFRVLKPGGRFMLADQVLAGELPKEIKARIDNWARWEGGAIPGKDFLALIQQAGFSEGELAGETGFNSSPVTKGVLIRAVKPAVAGRKAPAAPREKEDQMEYLLGRALELGAEKAKLIDTETVTVAEWVRWKCHYGCPLFDKDAFHPPLAPDAESTRKVLKEYHKAILLNGPEGMMLTEAAVRLEGEAYHRGYYKAFALTALVPGPGAPCGASNPDPAPKPGGAWPSGGREAPAEPLRREFPKLAVRPMMEACGIDVFRTARNNGFDIDTRKETYGRWNYFALVLIE